jgi:hypothetical protein
VGNRTVFGRIEVNSAAKITLLAAFTLLVCGIGNAWAQPQDVYFHWAPCPVIDGDGIVRPEAVSYEVWLKRGDDLVEMIATVPDTTYLLSAEPGVTQRIRVRGLDRRGRKSALSEWSDPIYFENGQDVVTAPRGAKLKGNYPNPFNPETRIRYGVPEDIQSGDVVRLEIFAVNGQRVRTLVANRSPGWHEAVWDGKDDRGLVASTGMYVTRFAVGGSVTTHKMTMVK